MQDNQIMHSLVSVPLLVKAEGRRHRRTELSTVGPKIEKDI